MFTQSRCVELFAYWVGEKTGVEAASTNNPLPIHNAGDNCQPSFSHLVIMEMN
jgi:hypothetical protein